MRAVFAIQGRPFAFARLRVALCARGWEVVGASAEGSVLELVRTLGPELVAVHVGEDVRGALDAARRIREVDRGVRILLVAKNCSFELAIAAMRSGMNDVLAEDADERDIDAAIARAVPAESPVAATRLRGGERLVGASDALARIRRSIERVAATDSSVLITGETGTGKELVAELIHANSRRRENPFVPINCAAIPDGLLESELFGYERGAFTGAHAAREGKLQFAHGGTLFLDEIGDMTLPSQAKILRAIDSRRVQRLGGHRNIPVDIRIIAATNQNLERLTSQQKFRQDLYFRLNVARIHLPPIREHQEDLPLLVNHILAEMSTRMERRVDAVEDGYLHALMRYDWPGNVRELRNVVESTLVFCTSPRMSERDLPPHLRPFFTDEARKSTAEREIILAALRSTGWNRSETARRLGCSRMTLYRKMVRHQLFGQENEEDEGRRNVAAQA